MAISGHVDTLWKHLWTRENPCRKAKNKLLCPRVHSNTTSLTDAVIGRIQPSVGNAAANIARALVATREAAEFDARLSRLEADDLAAEPPA